MRVLVATDAFPPECGGSGWSTWELARGLRQRGHELFIVQPRPGRERGVREREFDGFRVVEPGWPAPNLPFIRNYFKNERLTRLLGHWLEDALRDWRIDLLHAQHVLTIPPAVAAGQRAGKPVVCTIRDYWPVCYWSDLIVTHDSQQLCPACTVSNMTRCVRPRAGHAWPLSLPMIPYMRDNLARKREALSRARAVIAVSSTIAADLRARAPELRNTRIEMIPNPLNVAEVQNAAVLPRLLQEPYALYVGKIAPNKGTRFLIDVVRDARLGMPLVVVGDGPDRVLLEQQAAGAGLDVRFMGWRERPQVLQWMAHASLLMFPSLGPESLSRVLLEAGALGVAIAAMDTGGTRDIIEHERTGLLSGSPAELAGDVARLEQDTALRARLGLAVRSHVCATFGADRVLDRIEALYRDVLGPHHGN